ncbi:MAG: heavy-metal-associated domain-containing protein [Oscillibacter sp.]
MTSISVPDMMCENCVKRITKALSEAGLEFSVNLEAKRVSLDGDGACIDCAVSALEDLGFTPAIQK